MEPKYDYSDIKLTCPFCQSPMVFHDVLIGCLDLPYYIHYACDNRECEYEAEIKFEEFEKRICHAERIITDGCRKIH